jgi:hypothetical protein
MCHVTKDVAIAHSSSITHYTLQYSFGHMASGPLGRTLAAWNETTVLIKSIIVFLSPIGYGNEKIKGHE